MRSLFDLADRRVLLQRVAALQPSSTRQWGKMDVAQMLAHCAVAFEVPCGDRVMKQGFIGRLVGPFAKKRLLSGRPMGRNAPTHPTYRVVDARDFARERQRLSSQITRLCERGEAGCDGVVHPFFGALTGDEWGRLMHAHLDHHLRQFGS